MLVLVDRVGDEILISVPFAMRDRVKKIDGFRWDPGRKVWVFPFSDELHRKLEQEFGAQASFSGFETTHLDGGDLLFLYPEDSVLRMDLKLLNENLLKARDRIEALEKALETEKARVRSLMASETVLTDAELEFLRAYRESVLEQARRERPIAW